MGFEQIEVELIRSWGDDKNIAHAAWVSSYEKNRLESKTDDDIKRVVSNIIKNAHGTPKETVFFEFYVRLPIFGERQLDKYRLTYQIQDIEVTFLERPFGCENITQNELSGRYRTIPDRPYELPNDVVNIVNKCESEPDIAYQYHSLIEHEYDCYSAWIDELKHARDEEKSITGAEFKRVREVLRGVLGTSYMTDMRLTMNLHSFEHLMNQRLSWHAQPEVRVTAYRMLQEIVKANVASVAITQMIETNSWMSLMKEIEEEFLSV